MFLNVTATVPLTAPPSMLNGSRSWARPPKVASPLNHREKSGNVERERVAGRRTSFGRSATQLDSGSGVKRQTELRHFACRRKQQDRDGKPALHARPDALNRQRTERNRECSHADGGSKLSLIAASCEVPENVECSGNRTGLEGQRLPARDAVRIALPSHWPESRMSPSCHRSRAG